MFQFGNAAENEFKNGETHYDFDSLKPTALHQLGWCKGFTRPCEIRIRPTGNVGNCILGYTLPEEFGRLGEKSMAEIVNNMQTSRVYQMFKDGSIERYIHEIDQSIFPESFNRSCEPMMIVLTYGLIKERIMQKGVNEPQARMQANQEVAKMYKFTK